MTQDPQSEFAQNLYPQGQDPQSEFAQNQYPQGQDPQSEFAQNQYPQGQDPQSQYAQSQYPQASYSGYPVTEDPGRTLGIVGLVLAFFVSLAGLIVSIIARNKSKAAGFNNGIALAGIIVGAVFTVLGILWAVLVIVLGVQMQP